MTTAPLSPDTARWVREIAAAYSLDGRRLELLEAAGGALDAFRASGEPAARRAFAALVRELGLPYAGGGPSDGCDPEAEAVMMEVDALAARRVRAGDAHAAGWGVGRRLRPRAP